jgi:hypothetical protein
MKVVGLQNCAGVKVKESSSGSASRYILGVWDDDLLAGGSGTGGYAMSGVTVVLHCGTGGYDDAGRVPWESYARTGAPRLLVIFRPANVGPVGITLGRRHPG